MNWYYIKAKDKTINKPSGKVITFWLYSESKESIKDIIFKQGCVDIEWIKQKTPPFI